MTFRAFHENLCHAQFIELGHIRLEVEILDLRFIEFYHDGVENTLEKLGVEEHIEIIH
jgi:hypothetical protein